MLVTLLCILLLTFSGSVLTYLYSDEDSLPVRLGAGNIIGSVLFGLVAFLVGCAFGLTVATVLLSLLIALLPLALLAKKDLRERFWGSFKTFPEMNPTNSLRAFYYVAFLVLLYFFFDRAMIETPQGIFTGGSQNLGDLPFHLGAIFSFSEGQNLPPENPSYAFAKFTYPFMADFLAACFVTLGAKARDAMLWQNVTLGVSLVVLFEHFTFRLTKNARAGKLAPVIFLFCGGLGFLIFFRDYWHDGRSILEYVWNLSSDYTIREKGIRWGNSLTTLFITQRGFLLGMPLMLIVLTYLWEVFTSEKQVRRDTDEEIEPQINTDEHGLKKALSTQHSALSTILIGLLAGTLPLVHAHSLAVLFVVSAFLFFFRLDKWRVWLAFGLSVTVVALPELLWIMTGSATRLREFVDWNFGWDARGENIFKFWAKNLGLFIPLLLLGIYFLTKGNTADREDPAQSDKDAKTDREKASEADGEKKYESQNQDPRPKTQDPINQLPITNYRLLIFYSPFLLVFFVGNLVKLAPWEWDNIKVLIYWYVASVPFVAWLLAALWEGGRRRRRPVNKVVAAACLIVLTFSGALDVWRVVSRQINYQVFSRDAVAIAEQIKQKTAPKALFLNAPTYNSAVVLAGRRSLMRYSGHLSSYGIDYFPRELEVKRIYEGSALAETFLKRNGIEYVLISPEERANLTVDEAVFSKYPVIAQSGEYRVYQIKK